MRDLEQGFLKVSNCDPTLKKTKLSASVFGHNCAVCNVDTDAHTTIIRVL